jgi:hypothetical protein
MNAPIHYLESLLSGPLADVISDDVTVSGLDVLVGDGRTFGSYPDVAHRDGAADMLRRQLDARDERDGELVPLGRMVDRLRAKAKNAEKAKASR